MKFISADRIFTVLEKTYYLPLFLLILAGFLMRAPYAQSFWVDETLSWWLISGTAGDCIWRALQFQGQSPFYYLTLFIWSKAFGISEISLRSLSLVCGIISSGLFFLLLRNFSYSIIASIAGVILFFSHDALIPLWVSARPYAFTMMFVVGSTLLFDRWLKKGGRMHGVWYVLSASGAFYAHYLAAPIIIVHFIWGIASRKRSISAFLSFFLWVALLCSFGGPHIATLFEKKEALAFEGLSIGEGFFQIFTPGSLLVVSGIIFALYVIGGKVKKISIPNYIMQWIALGVCGLCAVAILKTFPIVPRYFIWAIPAIPMLLALGIESSEKIEFQKLALVIMTCLFAMLHSERQWKLEDFRASAAFAHAEQGGENTPIFLFSGLVEHQLTEAKDPDLLNEYLSAPLSYYGAKEIIPIVIPSVAKMAERAKAEHSTVILVLRSGDYFGIKSPEYFVSAFVGAGYSVVSEQKFSGLKGYVLKLSEVK